MKPEIFNLKFKRVNNKKYIIDQLVESYNDLPSVVKFGIESYFNDTYCVVYENYMISLDKFKFKCIERTWGLYVYKIPLNLPYRIDDEGRRIYEGDY